jgi:RHS repeat-associated protein
MHTMVTAPICTYSPSDITRSQSRAGEWNASFDFDVADITTATLPNIASTNESLEESSLSLCNSTGAFCCNHQYSVTAITTSAGAISERYAYTAYGQPTILNASGVTLQTINFSIRTSYTGREWDATLGLHHFRARWMSPIAGRFLGRDPIGYEGEDNDLYEYVGSSSLVFVDTLGNLRVRPDYDDESHHHPCGLKFSFMLPDPSKPPKVDLEKFAECVAQQIAKGKDPRKAGAFCAEKLLKGGIKDPTEEVVTWYGYAGCCEAYKYTEKYNDGDPCGHATPNSLPPGTPPQGPCWKSPFPEVVPDNGPRPRNCHECCNFKACAAGVKGVLGGERDPFSLVKCMGACDKP